MIVSKIPYFIYSLIPIIGRKERTDPISCGIEV
jgi:hypothetical protein